MHRSRNNLDTYHNRTLSLHKPGVVPYSSQNHSPITSNRHKYELKQKIWPKQSMESWFSNHSLDDRRAVFSFLNTLYDKDEDRSQKEDRIGFRRRQKSTGSQLPSRVSTSLGRLSNHSSQRRSSSPSSNQGHESRASKHDLGEVLESLESFRPSSPVHEKGIQTSATPTIVPLPNVNEIKNDRKTEKYSKRSVTSLDKFTETVQPQNTTDNNLSNINNADENNKVNRRYLSQTWRVINPREDMVPNVRPENNRSSFFNYTKKVYPEYFFIHPDWY
ncbi:unnamed protein product [Adineta steineri]|uniref:Uncharacterized protein n=1 Tax=Adineta steineri TaxID=433720 RepID=A0A818RM48_9BILA|nr:unnamed protein product [Adineta steineri]CAF3656041.1 unnamed protein product [Adineta steineri]